MKNVNSLMLAGLLAVSLTSAPVFADDDGDENDANGGPCPTVSFNGLTLDEEFGAGAANMTRCLENRKKVKIVMQVNNYCGKTNATGACVAPYGLRNVPSIIRDYVNTHGIARDELDLRVIVHGPGGKHVLKGSQFEANVKGVIAAGVPVYFCQNTVRSFMNSGLIPVGAASTAVIDGVQFVTGGLTALADLQEEGFMYIQP